MPVDEGRQPARIGFYSDAQSWGGAEIVLVTLLCRLPEWIHPVVIGVDEEITERLASSSPRATKQIVRPPSGLRDLPSIIEHRRAIVELELDILQVSSPSLYAARAALLAASTVPDLALVVVEHSGIHPPSIHSRLVKRVLSMATDAHVAVGHAVAKTVEAWIGLAPGSVRPIQNAVVDYGRTPREIGASQPVVVGTLARLEHLKGIDVLVDAAAEVPEARFRVGGEGPDREELIRAAELRGVSDRFEFLGWIDPRSLLTSTDIFVLPSRSEGLPLSVLEAMMRGLPVVASDVGSMAEAVVDGETGYLVEAGDARSLSVALARLAADPGLRRRMGAAGRERALRHFGAARMVEDYVQMYDELLSGSLRPGATRRSPSTAG